MGSERSYINRRAYDQIREFSSGQLQSDDASRRGVLLVKHTQCKTIAGVLFIAHICTVAGEQYLSILEDLSYSVVLGIDFALQFGLLIDCATRTWKFKDIDGSHPFELINCNNK